MAKEVSVVYVIDDDESVRSALVRFLLSADLHAETLSSTDELLNRPRQKKDACILIDIRMPGPTGLDLQQKLTAFDMRIPVIVISTSDDAQIRECARKLGAVSFFRKPVDDQALLDAIRWAISGTERDQT